MKPEQLNAGPDHLSRIEMGEEPSNLEVGLPHAQLFEVHVTNGHFEDCTLRNNKNCPERLHHPAEKGVSGARDRLFYHYQTSVQNGV